MHGEQGLFPNSVDHVAEIPLVVWQPLCKSFLQWEKTTRASSVLVFL
jgi:hypothetical protein